MAHPVMVLTAPGFLPVEFHQLLSDALGSVEAAAGYLPITGGELLGPLLLDADPTVPNGAATKHYTDNIDNLKLNKYGDTMTGALVLAADGAAALQAVTVQQLAAAVAALNGTITALTDRVAALEAAAP